MAIAVVVKGKKSIEGALDFYTREEVLETEINAEQYGKQKAVEKVSIFSLPPVLVFQLLRFTSGTALSNKVTDRFEFGESLNLDKFIQGGTASASSNKNTAYKLHAVVVHSGGDGLGHYWTFIKPSDDDGWWKFNDKKVTKALKVEAVDTNFEGNTSAYALIYVRDGAEEIEGTAEETTGK